VKRILVGLIALSLVAMSPMAAAAPALNFNDERTPNPYIHSTSETVASHNMAEMNSPLEVYDDNGDVVDLPASYNDSQDTPFSQRMDKISAERYYLFPRISSESENGASWTKPGQWSTGSGATVADADADNVDKVSVDATSAGGTATFSSNVSITSDADKRVLFTVVNVDTLNTAEVQIRAVDSDGDYRYANISASEDASKDYVVANSTGNGYVLQERLANLPMAGTGDGSIQEITKVEVVSVGDTSKITLAGLDLDSKTTADLVETERDTDGDGDLENTVVEDVYTAGPVDVTDYESFGSVYETAVLKDFTVSDVRYPFSMTDDGDYWSEISDESASSYGNELEIYGDLQVPAYIDLSHGTLEIRTDQGLINDRYATVEIASDIDSSESFDGLNDSDYTDQLSKIGQKGDTQTLQSGVSADTTYRVHMVVYLKSGEVDALTGSAAMGPTGGGDGFFSTLTGQIVGVIGGLLGLLGLREAGGGN
jgi:hypothetical protein